MGFFSGVLYLCFFLSPIFTITSIQDNPEQQLNHLPGAEKADTLQQLAREFKYKDPEKALSYARSALKVLEQHPDDTLKARAFGRISRIYQVTGQYDSALYYARRFESISKEIDHQYLLANAYNYIGISYSKKGDYASGTEYIRKYVELCREMDKPRQMVMGYNNLGNSYLEIGDYGKSLEYYLKSLQISEEMNLENEGVIATISNIAIIYRNLDSLDKAMDYLIRASKMCLETKNRLGLSGVYNNMGSLYERKEHDDQARHYYQKSLDISRSINRKEGIASASLQLGGLEEKEDLYQNAMELYRHALEIYSQSEDQRGITIAHYRMGKCYRKSGNMADSRDCLQLALEQAKAIGVKTLIRDCNWELYQWHRMSGNMGQALEHYREYDRYEDTIYSKQSADHIAKWQTRYLTQKKEKRISLLEAQRSLQDARFERQKLFLILLIAGSVLILASLFIIYRLYRVKKSTNHQLSLQNEKILAKNREIAAQSRKLSEANEELKKLSLVASESDNLIFLADSQGKIEWVNHAVSRLYNRSSESFIGADIFSLSTHNTVEENRNIFYNKRQTIQYESSFINSAGQVFYFQTTLTPLLDSDRNIRKIIAVDSDITRLKVIEQDLIRKQKELEQANSTKDKFFSIISHDLKNPFNSLLGLSDLLVRKADRMDPEKIKAFHHSIHTTTRHAYDLLSNLLQWSRTQLQQITINPQEFNITELIDQNLSMQKERADEKGIELTNHLPGELVVYADFNMITTVVRNLVSNAIKFTAKGGKVDIDYTSQGDYYEFHVRDNGVGMSPEQIDKMFHQGEYFSMEGTDKEKGTGLGLILCREFVQKNHGEIYVTSQPGKGSTFSFTLPRQAG